jgi:hypothetical protein
VLFGYPVGGHFVAQAGAVCCRSRLGKGGAAPWSPANAGWGALATTTGRAIPLVISALNANLDPGVFQAAVTP